MVDVSKINLDKLSDVELKKLEKTLGQLERQQNENKLSFYVPYPKQRDFHDAGAVFKERLLSSGSQFGKTTAGGAEVAMHLCGRYPDWWLGRRFEGPTRIWVLGNTSEMTRENSQKHLLGENGMGTGMIPKDCIDEKQAYLGHGAGGLYDSMRIRHFNRHGKQDGWSTLLFKTYGKGQENLQGDTIHAFWCDEEPPLDVYIELLARVTRTNGMGMVTFTPLKGATDVYKRFADEQNSQRILIYMDVVDCPFFTPEKIAEQKLLYPKHTWAARLHGRPQQGEGAVFTMLQDDITCPPFNAPEAWSYLWGLDFGIQHPFAAVLIGWDKDNDVIYIMHTVRMSDALPLQHVAAMKGALHGFGNSVPAAWPQDGHQRREFEGTLTSTATVYRKHGQKMLDHHAAFVDGGNSTEAGIMEMQERFSTKRLRVFPHLAEWFQEYGRYHRKDGQLYKVDDDLMSATRVAIMAKRYARPILWQRGQAQKATMATGLDFNPFGS